MKNSNYPLLFVLLFAMLSYSCSKDDPGGGTPSSSTFTFPLKVGNTWSYQTIITETDTNGNLLSTEEYMHFWNVEKDTILKGTRCYRIVFTDNGVTNPTSHTSFGYYTQNAQGLFLIAHEGQGTPIVFLKKPIHELFNPLGLGTTSMDKTGGIIFPDSAIYVLKYPMKLNESWESNEFGNQFDFKRRYLKYESVSTHAGTFNCIKLDRTNTTPPQSSVSFTYYFGEPGLVQFKEEGVLKDSNGNIIRLSFVTKLFATGF